MTSKIEGHPKTEVHLITAVDGETFTASMSSPITAELSRFNSTSISGGSASTYGCTLSGRTVTFSTHPTGGGDAILTIKGRT